MNLKDYLAKKGKAPKGKTKDWMRFCTLEVTTGALWAGDPHLANADDGCVVKVPCGRYVVEGIGLAAGRDRTVARLRVRLESAKQPKVGKELGATGTDSAMIGVCDIKAFNKACDPDAGDEVQEAIEAQTGDGYGIIALKKFPGAVMPFVPTGGDGTGPVLALISGGKRVGIELSFAEEEEGGQELEQSFISRLGMDTDDIIARLLPHGEEVSFWRGGEFKAGHEFYLWSNAASGPVEYRIRRAAGPVLKDWSPMKKDTGSGPKYYCAGETLKAGKYEFEFRVANEVYSGLKLTLD